MGNLWCLAPLSSNFTDFEWMIWMDFQIGRSMLCAKKYCEQGAVDIGFLKLSLVSLSKLSPMAQCVKRTQSQSVKVAHFKFFVFLPRKPNVDQNDRLLVMLDDTSRGKCRQAGLKSIYHFTTIFDSWEKLELARRINLDTSDSWLKVTRCDLEYEIFWEMT